MSGFLRDFTAKRSEGLIGPSTDPPANGVEELQRMFEAIPPPTPLPPVRPRHLARFRHVAD